MEAAWVACKSEAKRISSEGAGSKRSAHGQSVAAACERGSTQSVDDDDGCRLRVQPGVSSGNGNNNNHHHHVDDASGLCCLCVSAVCEPPEQAEPDKKRSDEFWG